MTVYPDLAILLGLAVHGAVFRLCLGVLDLRRPWWQFWLCTLCSGMTSAMILIPQVPVVVPMLSGIALSALLLRGKSLWGTFFNLLTSFGMLVLYLGVFLILSGGIFRLSLGYFGNGGYFLLSFFETLIASFLAFGIGLLAIRIRKKYIARPKCCDCTVVIEGKTVPFRAYIDTGDFLTDPISGLPVVILEYAVLRRYIGADFPLPMSYEFATRFSTRARVIPYRSVSGSGQMLSAFVPELFSVNGIPRNAVIAVSDRRLECRGRFSGIIGPDLIGGD